VTQVSNAAAPTPGFGLGLPARFAILAAVFLAEKIFLNTFVDFDSAQSAQGVGALVRVAQHWGFRFLVAFAAALALFAYVRGGEDLKAAAAAVRSAPLRVRWMMGHFLLVATLVPLSYLLYRDTATDLSLAAVAALWIVVGVGAALAAALAMSPWPQWERVGLSFGSIWWYAAVAALLGTGAMQLAQSLWVPMAELTFDLVRRLLIPIIPALAADPATLILGTSDFSVQIAEACSGLEGMGLMLAFSGAWLLYFRREYIFPRALLLIPAGLVAIFALNVLRIAALIVIGCFGFPGVAIEGFHSQAGWIAFIAVACGLVLLSRHSSWLNRAAAHSDGATVVDNPTATYLMPLLAVLAAGALSRAMSSHFEFLYSLRLIAALLVFARYRERLISIDWRFSWRGPAVGVCVFLIWIVAAYFLIPAAAMPEKLAEISSGALRGLWILGRLAGAVLVVPIAEELAYRGYLMRRFMNADFLSVPYSSVGWPAMIAASMVFGLAHGPLWLPGMATGLVFGLLVRRRGTLGEAVAAHATANLLIAGLVLAGGQWQLW
jgi:exosortase E/protease (VPEID-CTERM system)